MLHNFLMTTQAESHSLFASDILISKQHSVKAENFLFSDSIFLDDFDLNFHMPIIFPLGCRFYEYFFVKFAISIICIV